MGDWYYSGRKRNDFRHTAVDDSSCQRTSRRNTKKWCKGKIGRDHTPKCFRRPGICNTQTKMGYGMNYRLQPNAWSCGPTALYNALLALGVPCGLSSLCNMAACTKEHGASEAGLKMAAWYYGVQFCTEVCTSHEFARACVRARHPLLVCVDRDSDGPYAHWIAVVKATSRHVWVADSARPGPVLRRLTWRAFFGAGRDRAWSRRAPLHVPPSCPPE